MIKKLIIIFILFIIPTRCIAHTTNLHVEYSGFPFEYKRGDDIKFSQNADKNMKLYANAKTATDKNFYIHEAMRYYFMLSLINKNSIDAQIGLGRVYDELKEDRYAKKHFFNAYNINPNNPQINLHFANFYYKRNDLINALHYYKKAYSLGYEKDYHLNHRMGCIHEKLADLETAKKFYNRAYSISSNNPDLPDKIRELDGMNYGQSQYYLFKK